MLGKRGFNHSDDKRVKGWRKEQSLPQAIAKEVRDFYGVTALCKDKVPNMQPTFKSMLLPKALLKYLGNELNIEEPNASQMQIIPAILNERDILSVNSTGTTLSYAIPALMRAFQQELTLPFKKGESPNTLILVENSDAAIKVQQLIQGMAKYMNKKEPEIYKRVKIVQAYDFKHLPLEEIQHEPVHILIGTVQVVHSLIEKEYISLIDTQLIIVDNVKSQSPLQTLATHANSGLRLCKPQVAIFANEFPSDDKLYEAFFKPHPSSKALPDPLVCLLFEETPGVPSTYKYETVSYSHFKFTYNQRREERMSDAFELLRKDPFTLIVGENKNDLEEFMDYLRIREYKDCTYVKGPDDLRKGRVLCMTDYTLRGLDLLRDVEVLINYDIPESYATFRERLGKVASRLSASCLKGRIHSNERERVVHSFVNRQSSIATLGEIKERVLLPNHIKVPEFMRDLGHLEVENDKERTLQAFQHLIDNL